MKANELMTTVTNGLAKMKLGVKKHSPEILVAVGVVGTVTSVVLACKATLKANDILGDAKHQLDTVHELEGEYAEAGRESEYSSEDAKKDVRTIYIQTFVKVAKLYAPAAGLCIVSLGSMIASNRILQKRNAALAAAYIAVDKGFREYRERVVDKFGEAVDEQLRFGIKAEEVEKEVTDEKTGKTKKVKQTLDVVNGDPSGYVRYFTRSNPDWNDDEGAVLTFFRAQQCYANDKLRAIKHVTLNDVYNMLNFKDSKAGMVVGWRFDEVNPTGDNYIEFAVKKVYLRNELGEFEEAYAVDFNVDGNIYDYMP